jgi:two-component system, NtrC family, response regulator AtoC
MKHWLQEHRDGMSPVMQPADTPELHGDSTVDQGSSALARAARHYLVVFDTDTTRMFTLPDSGDVLVGRADEADLRLVDSSVSRAHARLSVLPTGVRVSDLDSQNGTLVNDERIVGSRMLQSGDVLSLSGTTLVFHADARTGSSQGFVEPSAWRARLESELSRSIEYGRDVSVLVLQLGADLDRPRVTLALEPNLRRLDLATFRANEVLVFAPELDVAGAQALSARLLTALAPLYPLSRAGVATSPEDGTDADTLLAAARESALTAPPLTARVARDTFKVIELPKVKVVVADPVMVRLYALCERLAKSDLTVLITGETGSGKELLAQAIHHFSARRSGPLVAFNSAALAETLLESELFGHEKGAFTGALTTRIGLLEAANGGTVFLDELGELTPGTQVRLLRAIETRTITRVGDTKERAIDVRLVAATHRNLEAEVKAGRFREDLYFRLGGATLVLPPLRDRRRELPILARALLGEACERARRTVRLTPGAVGVLADWHWPGNVRELKNTLEYLATTVPDDVIESWHVTARLKPVVSEAEPPTEQKFRPIGDELRELEKRRISEALAAHLWNQTKAAEAIGMPLRTFVTRLKQFGIKQG